jgi:hypothetical protein
MNKSFSKRKISKLSRHHKKTRRNFKKTRKNRNKKGGFLFDQGINIGGIDLSRQTGKKQYNWKTGQWDNLVCYGVGPFKWCKAPTPPQT